MKKYLNFILTVVSVIMIFAESYAITNPNNLKDKINEYLDKNVITDTTFSANFNVAYPIIMREDSDAFFYQELPELEFINRSYIDSLYQIMQSIDTSDQCSSFRISIDPKDLCLDYNEQGLTPELASGLFLNIGYVTIVTIKIPVYLCMLDWPHIEKFIYKIIRKTQNSSTIATKNRHPFTGGGCYVFKYIDDYHNIEFLEAQLE